MGWTLILTDDNRRSNGLVEELYLYGPLVLLNIYEAETSIEPASSIVVDIFDLRSHAIARLRRLLGETPRRGPLVMLLHKDIPRVRILAIALGAALTLCSPFDISRLKTFLAISAASIDPAPLPPMPLS